MAQQDVIDLDAILADPSLLESVGIKPIEVGETEEDKAEELRKLQEYGYRPRPMLGPMGRSGMDIAYSYQQAIDSGFLADDPFFLQEKYLKDVSPEAKARYAGVDFTGGASTNAIRTLNFLPADLYNEDNITKILQKTYSEKGFPRTYDFDVKKEPNTGRYVFKNPENDGNLEFVNPPGAQFGDFLSFVEPVALEILGGVAGAAAGSAVPIAGTAAGAVVGETAATYFWRIQNLKSLQDQGLVPNDYDINMQALGDAAMTAGFGLGANTLFKAIQLISKSRNVPLPISEKEFVEAYNKIKEKGVDEISDFTTPQLMMRGREEGVQVISPVEGVEAGLRDAAAREGEVADPLRQKYLEQQRAKTEAVDRPFEEAGVTREGTTAEVTAGPERRQQVGEDILRERDELLAGAPEIQARVAEIDTIGTQSDDIFRSLTDGSLSPEDAGKQIRNQFIEVNNNFDIAIDDAYEKVLESVGDTSAQIFSYRNLKPIARKEIKKINAMAFGSSQDKQIMRQVLESIEQPMKSYEVLKRDLSAVRSLIRDGYAAGKTVDDMAGLFEIRDALLRTRNRDLKNIGSTEAIQQLNVAENLVRDQKKLFNERVIKNFTDTVANNSESFRMGDRNAFNNFVSFLNQGSTPDVIADLLLDPANEAALSGVKNGIRGAYLSSVTKVDDAGNLIPVSPTAHRKFMEKNKPVLEQFFDEDELLEFSNAESFIKNYRNRIAFQEQAIQKLQKEFGGNINISRPETIFNQTWRKGEFSDTAKVKNIILENDELTDAYKSYIHNDFLKKTSIQGLGGEDTIDPRALKTYLDDHGDALEVWFGGDFVNGLREIQTKFSVFEDINSKQLASGKNPVYDALNSLTRAYVGLFTTPGRFLTAFKAIYGAGVDRQTIELLSDPEKLMSRLKRKDFFKDPTINRIVRLGGRIYYREDFSSPIEQPEEEEAELQVLRGPGSLELNRGGVASQVPLMRLKY